MALRTDRAEPLFGREAELATLRDRVTEAAGGCGGAVLIVGDAGIGKTSLLRRAVAGANARGYRTLVTTGAATRRDTPLSGLDPFVHPYRANAAALPSSVRVELERVFDACDSAAVDPSRIARAVIRVVGVGASDQPVVVAVDDLHLLDRPSIDAIAELARLAEGLPLVVVAVTRTGCLDQSAGAYESILQLGALSDGDARLVLERNAQHLSYVQREQLVRRAAGNPLALVELPKAIGSRAEAASDLLLQRMPQTNMLRRSFAQGLHDLSPAARDAVLIAAAEDETAVHELVAATGALAGHDVGLEIFDEVVSAGLLYGDDMRLQFRHQIVRSVVLQEESMTRRQQARRAIADVVGDGPRRVWHEAQSVPVPHEQLGDQLEQIHRLTLEHGTTAAIAVLERAAQLSTDPDKRARRWLRAADLASTLGAVDLVERFADAASRHPMSDARRAYADVLRARFAEERANVEPSALCDLAQQAIADGDHEVALDLLLAAAERAWWVGTDRETRTAIDEVAQAVPGAQDDARLAAIRALAAPIANGRAVSDCLGRVDTALVRDPQALRNFGLAAHAIGDPPRASALLAEAEARCRADGLLGLLPQVLCVQAAARLELGDWDRASALAAEAAEVAEHTEQWNWVAAATVVLARAYALQGDGDRAMSLAGESEHLAGNRGLHDVHALGRIARGSAWLSAGQYVEAYDELSPLFHDDELRDIERQRMSAIMLLVEAAVHTQRDEDARRVIAGIEATARLTPSPLLGVQLLFARAVLALDGDAEERYRDALAQDLVRWPWVRARIELAYGSWLRRQRRAVESRPRLRAACETLESIGAHAWAERARTELRAAGERRPGERGGDGAALENVLSPQELEIARLAAEGLSNREIGQRLFLSHRTVGSHLYRIFPKLGITSRRHLLNRVNAGPGTSMVAA